MALRVLSLDGGGVRGILSARVLVELETITGKPTADLFDLVAGTASGGVLALGVAAPSAGGRPRFRAADLLELYLHRGHELFPRPDPTHRFRHLFGLRPARHPAAKPLRERFGETPLGDALVDVIVPTFDLSASAPLLLRSDEFGPGIGPPMRDIALATSSAPTHFPPVRVELGSRAWALTHGGLAANNPAPFAYAAALARAEPDQVIFVSVGTGNHAQERRDGSAAPGSARWPLGAGRSFERQLEGSSEAQHQMLDALLAATGHRGHYWRIQPTVEEEPHDHGLGDTKALSYMADAFVAGARPTLNDIADRVTA